MVAKGPGLNPEQKKAVEHLSGPLLIFAGAGSGKTRVITHRIQNLIRKGVSPNHIVAVTFTNRSAREMKERLSGMLERKKRRGLTVCTFHSLGNRILRSEIEHLQPYRVPFSILSADDVRNVLSEIYRDRKLDPDEAGDAAFLISLCKNAGSAPEDFARASGFEPELFGEIFNGYRDRLRALNSVDFDDLILLPGEIFEKFPDIRDKYRRRFRQILVDEFQDTNPAQYGFLRSLLGADRNICVVGDDDQSIYGWRGADVGIIRNFRRDFPGAKTVKLERNYRSTAKILQAANAVIARNANRTEKRLVPTGKAGAPPEIVVSENEAGEAEAVVSLISEGMVKKRRKPGDFAILFRTNFQSRAFETELRNRGLPYHLVGGYRFFDRREVRDALAWLRVILNVRDEVSLKRIINRPRRGVGAGTLEKINAHILASPEGSTMYGTILDMMETPKLIAGVKSDTVASIREFLEFLEKYRRSFRKAKERKGALTSTFREMLGELKFETEFLRDGDKENTVKARLLNLSELVNMLSFFEENREEAENPTLADFLARVSLLAGDSQEEEPSSGRVQLLTLHLAKGLEYPVVFLTGMEEDLFPAKRALEESADPTEALAEERRLFYVGLTRAREELFLTAASGRRRFGETVESEPSRFLDELPEGLAVWHGRELFTAKGKEDSRERARNSLLSGLEKLSSI